MLACQPDDVSPLASRDVYRERFPAAARLVLAHPRHLFQRVMASLMCVTFGDVKLEEGKEKVDNEVVDGGDSRVGEYKVSVVVGEDN